MRIPFSGAPLNRADTVRSDPARLAELRRGGRSLRLDGLLPELEGDTLATDPLPRNEGELVFLGLRDGQALFAAVPEEGNTEPAYTQRSVWDPGPELTPHQCLSAAEH